MTMARTILLDFSLVLSSAPAAVPRIRVVLIAGSYFTLDHRRLYALREGMLQRKCGAPLP